VFQPLSLGEFSRFARALANDWGHKAQLSGSDNSSGGGSGDRNGTDGGSSSSDGGGAVFECSFAALALGLRLRFVAELGAVEVVAEYKAEVGAETGVAVATEAAVAMEAGGAESTEGDAGGTESSPFTPIGLLPLPGLGDTPLVAGDVLLAVNGVPLGWVTKPGALQEALAIAPRPLRLTLQRPSSETDATAAAASNPATLSAESFEWSTEAAPEEKEEEEAEEESAGGAARCTHHRIFDERPLGFTVKFVGAGGGSIVVAAVVDASCAGPWVRVGDVLVACNNRTVGPVTDPRVRQAHLTHARPLLLTFMHSIQPPEDHRSSSPRSKQVSAAAVQAAKKTKSNDGDFAPPRYPPGRVERGPGMGAAVGIHQLGW
jgi:hypothetical protein